MSILLIYRALETKSPEAIKTKKSAGSGKTTTIDSLLAMRQALADKRASEGNTVSQALTKTLDTDNVNMTKFIQHCIDLQNAVNCYMDSSKG